MRYAQRERERTFLFEDFPTQLLARRLRATRPNARGSDFFCSVEILIEFCNAVTHKFAYRE